MSGFKFVRIALRAGAFASWMVSQSVLAQSMDNMQMAPPDKQQQTSKQKTTQPQPEQKQEEMKMPGMSEQGTEPNAKSPGLKPEQPEQKKPEPGKPEEKKPDEKMQHEMSMPEKQDHQAMKAQGPEMQMPGDGDMHMVPESFMAAIEHHGTSGTSAEPNSTPIPMFMKMGGKWMFMFHGAAWINMEQQSSPRGYDKVFSTNWFMPMAQRKIGN